MMDANGEIVNSPLDGDIPAGTRKPPSDGLLCRQSLFRVQLAQKFESKFNKSMDMNGVPSTEPESGDNERFCDNRRNEHLFVEQERGFPSYGYTSFADGEDEFTVRRKCAAHVDTHADAFVDAQAGSSSLFVAESEAEVPGAVDVETPRERDQSNCIKVVVRVRPPLARELEGHGRYEQAFSIDKGGEGGPANPSSAPIRASAPVASSDSLTLSENLNSIAKGGIENGIVYNSYRFAFDRVYGPEASQESVYNESARDVVMNVLQGYNASIIAYGQTGAGKTHTMTGALEGADRGVIPRAVDDIFQHIAHDVGAVGDIRGESRVNYLVRASYLQVYNEVVSDLLKPAGEGSKSQSLTIREDSKRGVYVEGLSEWVVRSPSDVYDLMARGSRARTTGSTRLNELSSRSHAIFIIVVEKSTLIKASNANGAVGGQPGQGQERTVRMGKLNLVDLAGSERVRLTGASGVRLQETKKINQSLSALGNVIGALTSTSDATSSPTHPSVPPVPSNGPAAQPGGAPPTPQKRHVPYRDSKLTRILEDSLGGNCKTAFVAVISPAVESFSESLSTLKFANRAKRVKNVPRVNEDENHRTLLKKYERELKRLRAELQARGKDLVDKRLLLQLEEARRKEQADKMAAMSALERQSAEIARQKAAMASLQKRISSMQGQLLVGGQGSVEDTPAFRTLLAREQNRIKMEYEARLAEMENERSMIAEDEAATEKLKSLLLKQRDVMVALTKRLGERDQEVFEIQASLEATEAKLKSAEDVLDKRTAQMIRLRRRMAEKDRGWQEDDGDGHEYGDLGRETPRSCHSSEEEASAERSNELKGPLEVTMVLQDDEVEGDVDGIGIDSHMLHDGRDQNEDAKANGLPFSKVSDASEEVQKPASPSAKDTGPSAAPSSWQSEKAALKTILELKVLSVIGDVETSVGGFVGDATVDRKDTVARQLAYLKKLVEMTVMAMTDSPI